MAENKNTDNTVNDTQIPNDLSGLGDGLWPSPGDKDERLAEIQQEFTQRAAVSFEAGHIAAASGAFELVDSIQADRDAAQAGGETPPHPQ